jgi:hypothetical protein
MQFTAHFTARGAYQNRDRIGDRGRRDDSHARQRAAKNRTSRRKVSGSAEGAAKLRYVHQLPAAECLQIRTGDD